MGIKKVAHAALAVDDFDAALRFHTEVIGMHVLARENGRVFLGCGLDGTTDLELTAGGTGVTHFALEVQSEEDIADYAERVARLGVATEARSDAEPGQAQSLRLTAPTGHVIDLVLNSGQPAYQHPVLSAQAASQGVAPRDFDHITLQTPDVAGLVEFLTTAFGFAVSDVFQPAPGVMGAAWTRVGDMHHDVAIIGSPEQGKSLHHYALMLDSFEDIKRAADLLAIGGTPIEAGPGRHGVGGNLYAYVLAPGGNRLEFSAEMPRVSGSETTVFDDFPRAFSPWGAVPPESFGRSS